MPDKTPTRKNILSILSSVYDPLGILAPVVLPAKGTLQELCRLKIGWDVPIPDEFARKWCAWKAALQQLVDISVPRCFKPAGCGDALLNQLHHLNDTSSGGSCEISQGGELF